MPVICCAQRASLSVLFSPSITLRNTRVCDTITQSLRKSRVNISVLMRSAVGAEDPNVSMVSEQDSLGGSRALLFADLAGGGSPAAETVEAVQAFPDVPIHGMSQLLFGSEIHPQHSRLASTLNDSRKAFELISSYCFAAPPRTYCNTDSYAQCEMCYHTFSPWPQLQARCGTCSQHVRFSITVCWFCCLMFSGASVNKSTDFSLSTDEPSMMLEAQALPPPCACERLQTELNTALERTETLEQGMCLLLLCDSIDFCSSLVLQRFIVILLRCLKAAAYLKC